HVRAALDARYEEQDGVVVTVYDLDFEAEYHLTYPGPAITTTVELFFPFPANLETLHDVQFLVNGAEPAEVRYSLEGIRWQTELQAGQECDLAISYRADGVSSFIYALDRGRRADLLDVRIAVQNLPGSQVPEHGLPVTDHIPGNDGDLFAWEYANLIPSRSIQVNLPAQMGFAQRVEQLQKDFHILAGLAPFLVGGFLLSLAGLLHLRGTHLPLTVYLLTGCGLALFYPLLTFLSGLVHVILAAGVSFLLVSGLVLLFLGLTAGWRQTAGRIGLLLLIFLGLFSLGTLTSWWRLLLTGGGLLLIGAFMVQYARRSPPSEESATSTPFTEEQPSASLPETAPAPESSHCHCPHCGRELADDHAFCPGCGHDVQSFHRCAVCGHQQFVPPSIPAAHCVRCGRALD
ncbi:MAG TPA: zinc-ribbon domain-containing protein, partial [Chloroflexi bacterium]|nr:zinc-ribbon domain-containing protein [Chloroflexota bacterium]